MRVYAATSTLHGHDIDVILLCTCFDSFSMRICRYLDLASNQLSGSIPVTVSNLTALSYVLLASRVTVLRCDFLSVCGVVTLVDLERSTEGTRCTPTSRSPPKALSA